MYIKRVEIDGFKSYAQKQSVGEFDSQFNAITGLNGTGKSNILDSICFVLGITNLSCIRAGQMNDLVYKMGQAGINKATVTITFDNSDKKQSPLGYQAYSEIIVRRQVIVNGRNTYTINGTAMPQNKVADFFRGVGLNVNNPHFLIMQGRITKVLNMKPGEILGMLEEAAGTKMYDAKRDLAVGLIAKKDIKLGEIEATLNKDILPTVERLKQDRANYLEWQRCDRDIAQKERKLIAFIFYQSGVESKKANERAAEMEEKLAASDELDTEFKNLVVEMEEQYKEMEDLRDGQNKGERSALDDRAKIANNELAKLESEYDAIKADQKKQENELKRLEKAVAQDSKELQGKRTELTKLEQDKGGEEQKGEEAKERVEKARTHLAAVLQGMTTDSEGKAITIETQINQAKEQLEQLTAEVKNAQTREKQICSQLDDKRRQLAELTRRADSEESELDKLTAERQRVERDMKGVVFDKTRFETVSNRARDVGREKQEADGRLRDTLARNNNIHFQYNRNVLPASFDERTVYGCAVRHIRPIDKKFNTAVEVTSGSQAFKPASPVVMTGKNSWETFRTSRSIFATPVSVQPP